MMPAGDYDNASTTFGGMVNTLNDTTTNMLGHTLAIDPAAIGVDNESWGDVITSSAGPDPVETADRKHFGDHKKCDRCPVALECMAGSAARTWQLPVKFSEVKDAVRIFCIEKGQVKLIPLPDPIEDVGAYRMDTQQAGPVLITGASSPVYTSTNAVGNPIKVPNTWAGDGTFDSTKLTDALAALTKG